ncbi:MAG TPA: DUF6602 domain-containing protein [Solirubrobacterales bacterium]|nr:DUF6602 domain-containing protein [Solirubrobacterales bacterium]
MSALEQYWAGVLQRLRAEVDVFARLVRHMGERGRLNELALAHLLEGFVPERVGVGSGLLIDSEDQQSQQTDVVLFDQGNQPRVMAQTTQVLFPVEVVLGCVEVKTSLGSGEVSDCLGKAKSLRELKPVPEFPGTPPFAVLAYNAGLSPEGFVASFARDPDNRPELLCVLENGLVAGGPGILSQADEWQAGLCLAQAKQEDRCELLTVDGSEERVEHEGHLATVVDHGGVCYVADPGRALLLFAEALARLVAQRSGTPSPAITHYLGDQTRDLLWLSAN